MLPSHLPRVKVGLRIGQVYAEYTQEPPRIYWLWTRAERKLPQSESITMARASEERAVRMSGEDTPTAEASVLRGGKGRAEALGRGGSAAHMVDMTLYALQFLHVLC